MNNSRESERIYTDGTFLFISFDCFSSSEMFKRTVCVTVLLSLESMGSGGSSIGLIRNVSLWFRNTSYIDINGDCEQCLCQLNLNETFSSLNCYKKNQTCRMHYRADKNRSFQIIPSAVTTFYFLSLPSVSSTVISPSCQRILNASVGKKGLLEMKSRSGDEAQL
jgi:hypothetical protein